jgi:hypothetical protein
LTLGMHPQAKENWNRKAEELVTHLRPVPVGLKKERGTANPDLPVSHHFNPSNIVGEMRYSWADFTGNIAARAFSNGEQRIGLFEDDHTELIRISEGMRKSITPRNTVSISLLSELIFDWMKHRHRGESNLLMTDFVLAECEKRVKELEIWIPISHLFIVSPFTLGKITFKAITKTMVDDWEASRLSKLTKPEALNSNRQFFESLRKDIQALAAATIKLEAEPRRAYEIACEEAEKAMSILRFFSPATLHPAKVCYSALWGKQHQDMDCHLTVQNGKIIGYRSGFSDQSKIHWNLGNDELQMCWDAGLGALGNLLNADKLTDFQETLLEALFIYSKSTLAKQLSDKLLYILVALESVFLKDSGEYIQDAISLRMAYMHPVSIEERGAIIRNVKATYALRSSFIHHGQNIGVDDVATLEEFMKNAWMSLQAVIPLAATGITKEEFFKGLEDRRLSG